MYENHIPSLVFPGERWIDTFLVETVQPMMENDANPLIRPMTFYVESPERVSGLFDNVAYSKGEFKMNQIGSNSHVVLVS